MKLYKVSFDLGYSNHEYRYYASNSLADLESDINQLPVSSIDILGDVYIVDTNKTEEVC